METNIDSPKYQGQRNQMVSKLESLGINDKNVLIALNNVPRHLFMDPGLISHSYKNNAYPIDSGQTISQPYTVAFQTQLIKCKKGDKVLEIGTGSGYQTAILSYLGFDVFTIERDVTLFKKSSLIFKNLSIKIKMNLFADGHLGIKDSAPFDGIIVTAAAKEIPKNLDLEGLKLENFYVDIKSNVNDIDFTTIDSTTEKILKHCIKENINFDR